MAEPNLSPTAPNYYTYILCGMIGFIIALCAFGFFEPSSTAYFRQYMVDKNCVSILANSNGTIICEPYSIREYEHGIKMITNGADYFCAVSGVFNALNATCGNTTQTNYTCSKFSGITNVQILDYQSKCPYLNLSYFND